MKVSLLASVLGAFAMSGGILLSANAKEAPARDTRIIVELDRGLSGLSVEQVKNVQKSFIKLMGSNVTTNYNFVQSYTVLNNAVVLDVNSNDVEAIRSMDGVKSVTVDSVHWKKIANNDEVISITKTGNSKGTLVEENISATTMYKPADTNDGEGTVIAILDNEFYLKGATDGEAAWNHEVFTPLASGTIERFTFDNLTEVVKGTNARRMAGKAAGEEGSLYFNNKVPFYFDYGGLTLSYGKAGEFDFDVHSALDYHGSHVASIAAANAPRYKGIAPKAQLACMKVFTEYKADKIAEDMGFSTYSGAYDSCILSALEDCITLGVDGINMSLGSDLDDFDGDSITLKTLTRLSEAGIMSAISAGNSGKSSYSFVGGYGNWTSDMVETGILSSYANNKSVMTIASGQPDQVYYEHALKISTASGPHNVAYEDQIINREGLEAEYSKEFKLEDLIAKLGKTEFEYVYIPGFGTAADYAGLDVTGKIAVVNRGSTSFADKYSVAKNNKAAALIIINNDPTASDFNFRCSFGDDFNPTMPCALVLYKDKPFFEENQFGDFQLIAKEVSENDNAKTISTYSSDGAAFDYDLKPEITTPGELIRGAVPPQKKEDKENTPYSTYQYLSGTSMSAPNYAGCQSLVLSEVAKDVFSAAEPTAEAIQSFRDYRDTVDMRLMSTAKAMTDANENPEVGGKNYTSPRLQGAGMVNLNSALNTKVYLEGLDLAGNPIGKSKIVLKNEENIARGNINLSFLAHNESEETLNYNVKLTVMRPAIAASNKVIAKEYNYRGEADDLEKLPGIRYYDVSSGTMQKTRGTAEAKYVYKTTKQITYYATQADYNAHNAIVMNPGYWMYNSDKQWVELPSKNYQSVQDTVIAEVTGQTISIAPGTSTITINPYSLSQEAKNEILEFYQYGCAIEGYVELESTGSEPALSIPYLGFYSGTDVDSTKSYSSAPVSEPMNFEKTNSEIYASSLVNDLAKSLVGKDKADMGSMMVTGYAETPDSINVDTVLYNNISFDKLSGFRSLGTDPTTGEYVENPSENLYVGNPEKSNTLIVQQFVLRSVVNNNFTITNKDTNKVVYKSVLQDILYGEQNGKYPLYKSHADSSYFGNGIIAHRAYAIIPLYDEQTREAFADGTYDITFNYLLAATGEWVSKTYTIIIDSTNPTYNGLTQTGEAGAERVRIEFSDKKLAQVTYGYYQADVNYDETKGVYYIDEAKADIDSAVEALGTTIAGQKRLVLTATDFAGGKTTVICHFAGNDGYNWECVSVESSKLSLNNDFIEKDGKIEFIEINTIDGSEKPVVIDEYQTKVTNRGNVEKTTETIEIPCEPSAGGCSGSAATSCITVTIIASISLAALLFIRRKKQILGGK